MRTAYFPNEIRVNHIVDVTAKSTEKAQQQHVSSSSLKVVVNKRKRRKVEGCGSDQEKATAEGTENPNSDPQPESGTLPENKVTMSLPPNAAAPSPGLANLLEGYSSDNSEAD